MFLTSSGLFAEEVACECELPKERCLTKPPPEEANCECELPKEKCPAKRPPCVQPASYFVAHGGGRIDKVSCTLGTIFPNNFLIYDETVTAKRLGIVEAGARAQIGFDPYWFIKGYYYYGWVVHGKFTDQQINGKLRGNTHDGLGGIGYLNPIGKRYAIVVLGGWAYDEQKVHLKQANLPQFNGLTFQSIWNGPWLGLDFVSRGEDSFVLDLGYELHLANWNGAWILSQPTANAFSDRRKAGLSIGQVAFLNAKWRFGIGRWRLDVELKYQNWSTQSTNFINSTGNAGFSSAPISGPVSAVSFVRETTWVSYSASLNLGYSY